MPNRKQRTNRKSRRGQVGRRGLVSSNVDTKTLVPIPMTLPRRQPVRMQFRNYITMTTVSSLINTYLSFDPTSTTTATFGSVALFPEFGSYVSELYSRVKLLQFEIYLMSNIIDDTKGDTIQGLAIGSTPLGSLAVPNSYSTVIDNADSIMWNPIRDYSGQAKYHAFKASGIGWGPVGSPGGVTGYGTPGSFVFYGDFGGFSASLICSMKVVGTYLLDSRI